MNVVEKLKDKFGAGLFLFIATFLVNVSNYALNLVLGRWLGPEGFSEANLIATLVMGLSFVAMGVQLASAKLVAEKKEETTWALAGRILWISILLVAILTASAPYIASFLQLNTSSSIIIVSIGVPFYFLMSIGRGSLQGKTDFRKLAWTYIIEMVLRCVSTVALLWIFYDSPYRTEIIAAGFLISFIGTWIYYRVPVKLSITSSNKNLSKISKFLAIIMLYELSQILINNSDVVLVKHYFNAFDAGLYASLALLGRAVFFATWTVVTILFPKVIEKEKNGEPHLQLFWNALGIVGGIGLIMTIGSYFLGGLVLGLAFGSAYQGIADQLWIYTTLTSLFACANVFVYYYLSLEKYTPVVISILIGTLQIIAISIYHPSLLGVMYIQVALMTLMLLSMISYHSITNYKLSLDTNILVNQKKLKSI